jgi:hypothetical protein
MKKTIILVVTLFLSVTGTTVLAAASHSKSNSGQQTVSTQQSSNGVSAKHKTQGFCVSCEGKEPADAEKAKNK